MLELATTSFDPDDSTQKWYVNKYQTIGAESGSLVLDARLISVG